MKNTKLIALGLVSTLFIVSCGKKVEEKTTNTGVTSTGIVDSKINLTSYEEIGTGYLELEKTGTGFSLDFIKNEIRKVGDYSVLANPNSGYEVTYKVSDDLTEQKQQGIDLFLASKSGNIFSSVSGKFQEETLGEFLNKGFDEMKTSGLDVKKEEVEINGVKGFKLSFSTEQIFFEQYYFEGKEKTFILLSKTISDKSSENFDSIIKSFKLVK